MYVFLGEKMTLLLQWFIYILVSVCSCKATSAEVKPSPNQIKSIRILATAIQTSSLYAARRIECLNFFPESETNKHIIIAVHEKHSEACGGDLKTWPLVDRFSIAKPYTQINHIFWINPSEEQTLAFKKYVKRQK